MCAKIAGWVANTVDPDQTPRSAAFDLGLLCLLKPVFPNTYSKYGDLTLEIILDPPLVYIYRTWAILLWLSMALS